MSLKEKLFGNKWHGMTMTILSFVALLLLGVPIFKGWGWDVSIYLAGIISILVGAILFMESGFKLMSAKSMIGFGFEKIVHMISLVVSILMIVSGAISLSGLSFMVTFMSWVSIIAWFDIIVEKFV